MTTNSFTTIVTGTATVDLHVVLAGVEDADGRFLGYKAVSAPLTWTDAQAEWDRLDNARRSFYRDQRKPTDGGFIKFYAVRNLWDPRWANILGRGYRDAMQRKHPERRSFGDSGMVKAAKAWAAANGYRGAPGGWIYKVRDSQWDDPHWTGKPIVQGWDSFARRVVGSRIAQGADGLWYVMSGKVVTA